MEFTNSKLFRIISNYNFLHVASVGDGQPSNDFNQCASKLIV